MKYFSFVITFLLVHYATAQHNSISKNLEENIIRLEHNIEFYWQQEPFNSAKEFDTNILHNPEILKLPRANWGKLKNTTPKGFGTFLYKVSLPDTINNYSLYTPRFSGAAKIWVNNVFQLAHGQYNKELQTSASNAKPILIKLPKQKEIIVTILTSNHEHVTGGGIDYFLAIAKESRLDNYINKELVKDYVVLLLLIMLTLYLLYLYYVNKQNRYLYLMLACLTGCIRSLCIQQHIIYKLSPVPVPFYVIQKLRLMTVYLGTIFTLLYYKTLLPKQIHKRWFQFLIGIQIVGLVLYFFVSVYQANLLAKIMRLLFLISMLYCMYLVIAAVVKKEKYAKEILLTMVFIVVIVVNGVLKTGVIINTAYVGVTALFMYLLAHMYINAKIQKNQSLAVKSLSSALIDKEKENQQLKLETLSRIQEKEKIKTSLKEIPSKTAELKTVLAFIQSNGTEDQKAILLKKEIETNLHSFTNALQNSHPSLTKTDLEMAVFIVLGKTRQEIADLRGITIASVKTSRSRLRKKLALHKEVLLDDYLKSFL